MGNNILKSTSWFIYYVSHKIKCNSILYGVNVLQLQANLMKKGSKENRDVNSNTSSHFSKVNKEVSEE